MRILCVEDDGDVTVAADASDGIAHLERAHDDLVISDHRLPGSTGLWMLECADERGLLAGTKAVLVTAALTPPSNGRYRVLYKPVDLDRVLGEVARVLAR